MYMFVKFRGKEESSSLLHNIVLVYNIIYAIHMQTMKFQRNSSQVYHCIGYVYWENKLLKEDC